MTDHRSPLMIKIIMFYTFDARNSEKDYAQDTPHGTSSAVREIVADLIAKEILKPTQPITPDTPKRPWYEANFDACFPYLDALCKVPLPVLKWGVPNPEDVVDDSK